MPFLDAKNDQLPPLQPGMASDGLSTGFAQNFSQVFSNQYRVDSQMAFQAEMSTLYTENLQKFRELTGEDFGLSFDPKAFEVLFNQKVNPDGLRYKFDVTADRLKQFDARVQELKEQYPELKTFDELVQEVGQIFKGIDEETGRVSNRASFMGSVGGFLGGMAGSLTPRDPLLVTSMLLPLPTKGPAMRVLTEAAIGAGSEAFVQYGTIQDRREQFGLTEQSALQSILFAGAGAAALRGGLDAAPKGFRAAERQLFPERAQARIFRDTMDEALEAPLRDIMRRMSPQRLSDERLMEIAAKLNQTPSVRAATFGLQEGMDFARANPYGEGRIADIRFDRDLSRTLLEFNGVDLPETLRTDTAVGQFIDSELIRLDKTPEGMAGRMNRPDLYERVDTARTRVEEFDARITELEEAMAARTMADTVGLLDEVSGARVREIETELDKVIPRSRREALEAELDTITENLDTTVLAKAEAATRIGPKKEIAALRNARRNALKELRKAQRPVDSLEAKLRKQGEDQRRVAAILNPQKARQQAVRELHAEVKETDPRIPEVTETLVRGAKEASDGFVDLNTGERIPDDFQVHTGLEETTSVKAIMDDLAEDTNLLEAMRSCAI